MTLDRRHLLFLSIAMVAGCKPKEAPTSLGEEVFVDRREVGREKLRPWPEAPVVRLFVELEDATDPRRFLDPDGRLLSSQERKRIEASLDVVTYDKEPFAVAACFVPHHFLRYYTEGGAQVGELAICFCCAGVSASPDLQLGDLMEIHFGSLERILQDMGVPTDIQC